MEDAKVSSKLLMEQGGPGTWLDVPVDGFEVVHAELVVFS